MEAKRRKEMSVEARIVERLELRFKELSEQGRCIFAKEVRVLTWGHISEGTPRMVRPDFVVSWDHGPLVAIECKGRFEDRTDLGRALSQSADYARAKIGINAADRVPQDWLDRPIWAAALAYDYTNCELKIKTAHEEAHRIYGPRNVGFLKTLIFVSDQEKRGIVFTLGGERYWSEERGWRKDALVRGVRVGSGRIDAPCP
jgi:hypothetical protein